MGKNAAYAAQYAEEAKEQMRMYGIPASVILAQAILESSNGQSQLSRECNNHFGIKATASWLKNGGSMESIRMIGPTRNSVSTKAWVTVMSITRSS